MLLNLRSGDGLARADNLLPHASGTRTRPGGVQQTAAAIDAALGWGSRIVYASGGLLTVLDQSAYALGSAGRGLAAATYQALTADAAREDRLYVADGFNPLWYAARESGGFGRHTVVNSVLDGAGVPYPVPTSDTVATWRDRLWVGDGYRVRHSDAEAPAAWDPLFTLSLQDAHPSRVRALLPFGERLVVGTDAGLWAITGTSQFNWQRDQLVHGRGVVGPRALATDGTRLWWVSPRGLHALDAADSLSGGVLDPLFDVPDHGAQLEVTPDGGLLLLFVRGRLLVMNTSSGDFGEIVAPGGILGTVRTADAVGWYGPAGLWLLGAEDTPDTALDGAETAVTSVYETHDQFPNPRGRALLPRVWIEANGSDLGTLAYTCTIDGAAAYTLVTTLADAPAPVAFSAWDGDVRIAPTPPVQREIAVHRSGRRFRHLLRADCHIEIRRFDPVYQFGRDPREGGA